MERRRFIKQTAAVAGASWAAPAITSLTANANAQAGSPVPPGCACSGRGTALSVAVPGLLDLALGRSSGAQVCFTGPLAIPPALAPFLSGEVAVACGAFDAHACSASAGIESLGLSLTDPLGGGQLTVGATTLSATAAVDCDCTPARTSSIQTLTLNGQQQVITTAPNQVIPIPGFGQIVINERSCGGGGYVARALHISLGAGPVSVEIIAGEAIASNDDPDCVCSPTDTR